ncbi:hypothetical protein GN956_G4789 [Arapaima gigas]
MEDGAASTAEEEVRRKSRQELRGELRELGLYLGWMGWEGLDRVLSILTQRIKMDVNSYIAWICKVENRKATTKDPQILQGLHA